MIKKFLLSLLTLFLISTLLACNKTEVTDKSYAEYWNGLDMNQKQWIVATELEKLKTVGYTVIVEEYYFIDRLDVYYNDNPPGDLPVPKALKNIGFSTGTLQMSAK